MPTLGVVGTLVWDRIWSADASQTEAVEEWGGIGYALEAFEAAAPFEWKVRPILKVGRDLTEQAGRFLSRLRSIESSIGVGEVSEPNVRVELRYTSQGRRCERLTGGVPAWTFPELDRLLSGLDGLYINFIVGNEMGLETLQAVRRAFPGPIYGDLHSVTLATGPGGERTLRPLPRGRDWLRAFDVAQMNEDELATIAGEFGDPWRLAADVVGAETRVLFVTLGPRGAAYFAAPDFRSVWQRASSLGGLGPVRSSKLAVPEGAGAGGAPGRGVAAAGDPTGCGDVWGITCFLTLLQRSRIEDAVLRANRAAALNVRHRGATGLHRFLRGELATPGA